MTHTDASHAAARPEVVQREVCPRRRLSLSLIPVQDGALMNVPRQGLPSEVVPPTEVSTPSQQGMSPLAPASRTLDI